jgi:protein TonB
MDGLATGEATGATRIGNGQGGDGTGGTEGTDGGGSGSGGGDGTLRARCVSCPPPRYPPQALRNGWEGRVELRVRIDASGRVEAAEVARSSGFAALDQAALAAARASRFSSLAAARLEEALWGRMRYGFELETNDHGSPPGTPRAAR